MDFLVFLAEICAGKVVTDNSACPFLMRSCNPLLCAVPARTAAHAVPEVTAYLTPYKVVTEKENDENHSTVSTSWQNKYGTGKLRYSLLFFPLKYSSDCIYSPNDPLS